MSKTKTVTGWSIAYDGGLYEGFWYNKNNAIAQHVHDVRHKDEPDVDRICLRRALSDGQKQIWKRCRDQGDRVVKISITYPLDHSATSRAENEG